uniref:C-type lectin domain-containing protein n=1 Tax=Parastrongyloides trichosuri TaxID=131310 RepID=A0A0N4Z126_PARTI
MDKVDMEESTTTFTMSFNSSSIKMNDENDLGSPSFSKSLSAGSLISFAHLFISSVVNEDNDTPLGGEIAAEEDIDKDNWNNFQWNGQERPSLIELGTDDKTFWNSELWNSNDYNQNVICGINSEILEYCGAKGYDEDNEDYDVFRPENVDVQDDYIIAQEEEIIEALDNELKDCSYYEIN